MGVRLTHSATHSLPGTCRSCCAHVPTRSSSARSSTIELHLDGVGSSLKRKRARQSRRFKVPNQTRVGKVKSSCCKHNLSLARVCPQVAGQTAKLHPLSNHICRPCRGLTKFQDASYCVFEADQPQHMMHLQLRATLAAALQRAPASRAR